MASVVDVCILGAGASGLACAVECARELRRSGDRSTRVVVLEAGSKPGRSILASGNGRCNFSNLALASSRKRDMYCNAAFVEEAAEALAESPAVGVLPWFRQLGLVWRADDAGLGMLYPYSNKASSVLDVLLVACERWGVEVVPEVRISQVEHATRGAASFLLAGERAFEKSRTKTAKGRIKRELSWEPFELACAKLVIAVGGALPTESLARLVPGHAVLPFEPALTALDVLGDDLLGLDGVRAKVTARVLEAYAPFQGSVEHQDLGADQSANQASYLVADLGVNPGAGRSANRSMDWGTGRSEGPAFQESGEVLFRDRQISGILSFNLSRQLLHGGRVAFDFAPEYDTHDLVDLLLFMMKNTDAHSPSELLRGMFAPALARALARKAGIGASQAQLAEADIAKLAQAIKCFELEVSGVNPVHAPQVHRGGVAVNQLCPVTLESKKTPGLFVLGEAVDVDGPCGGYNLDWAWTSGILAGQAILKEILH